MARSEIGDAVGRLSKLSKRVQPTSLRLCLHSTNDGLGRALRPSLDSSVPRDKILGLFPPERHIRIDVSSDSEENAGDAVLTHYRKRLFHDGLVAVIECQ